MTCEGVQRELSRARDGDRPVSEDAARHASGCSECRDFQADSVDLERRYRSQVQSGLNRLRRAEGLPPWGIDSGTGRRPIRARWLPAVAAAGILCVGLLAMSRSAGAPAPLPPASGSPAPAQVLRTSPPRVNFLTRDLSAAEDPGEDLGCTGIESLLPVRLDQEWNPFRQTDPDGEFPVSMRF
jgi:hypothetical protein